MAELIIPWFFAGVLAGGVLCWFAVALPIKRKGDRRVRFLFWQAVQYLRDTEDGPPRPRKRPLAGSNN